MRFPVKPKVVIARMPGASLNKGEEAVLTAILSVMREITNDITVLSCCAERTARMHNVETVYNGIGNLWEVVRAIYRADLLVWGGGHMLQDKSSQLDILNRLVKIALAKIFGKSVLLYAVEIGPLNTAFGKFCAWLIFNVLNGKDLISVRNRESLHLFRDIGFSKLPIYVTADPAFALSVDRTDQAKEILAEHGIKLDRPVIGIAPRKIFYMSSGILPVRLRFKLNLLPASFFANFAKFKSAIAATADHLATTLNAQIVFVPMDVARNPRDDVVCRDIVQLMERPASAVILEDDLSADEVIRVYSLMDLVISLRFHALVFASMMNVPVIGVDSGQDSKIGRLMEALGQSSCCVRAEDVIAGPDCLINAAEEVWSVREQVQKELKPKIAELQKKARAIGHHIYSHFKGTRICTVRADAPANADLSVEHGSVDGNV